MHKIGSAHVHCMINYYTKFKYLGMKTFGVKIIQTRQPLSILQRKMSMFKTPQNELTIHEMYTK